MAGFVRMINTPEIKERVKQGIGYLHLAFGIVTIDHIVVGHMTCKESTNDAMKLTKIFAGMARLSFILSATVTPLGVRVIGAVINSVFTRAQLENVFGPNTIFEKNPWHPRHVVSFVAVAMALPAAIQYIFPSSQKCWVDRKIQQFAFISVLTSRPVLHQGNLFIKSLKI